MKRKEAAMVENPRPIMAGTWGWVGEECRESAAS